MISELLDKGLLVCLRDPWEVLEESSRILEVPLRNPSGILVEFLRNPTAALKDSSRILADSVRNPGGPLQDSLRIPEGFPKDLKYPKESSKKSLRNLWRILKNPEESLIILKTPK